MWLPNIGCKCSLQGFRVQAFPKCHFNINVSVFLHFIPCQDSSGSEFTFYAVLQKDLPRHWLLISPLFLDKIFSVLLFSQPVYFVWFWLKVHVFTVYFHLLSNILVQCNIQHSFVISASLLVFTCFRNIGSGLFYQRVGCTM